MRVNVYMVIAFTGSLLGGSKNFQTMIRFAAASAALAVTLFSFSPVRAAEQTTLASLESHVENSLTLQAARAHLQAADELEHVASARSGASLIFNNIVGRRSDLSSQSMRGPYYSQNAGVSLPLYGTRAAQRNAITDAQRDQLDAQAELVQAKLDLLARLRTAYVTYWQLGEAAALDDTYVGRSEYDAKIARALVKSGFWTHGQLLDFYDFYAKIRTDRQTEQSSQRAQLAILTAAVGMPMNAFDAADPSLDHCSNVVDTLLAAAVKADPEIAKINAQLTAYQQELKTVPGSAIDGSASVTLGTALVPGVAPNSVAGAVGINGGVSLSMPQHGREVQNAQARALNAEITEQQLLEKQRETDLRASIEAALEDLQVARLDLIQAQTDAKSLHEQLREAEVRMVTQRMTTQPLFTDVQTTTTQAYVADRNVIEAQATVQQKAIGLMVLTPGACGDSL